MLNFVVITKNSETMEDILDRKVQIGTEGVALREMLEVKQTVLIPLDETSLAANVVEGDHRTWKDFLGDNLSPDFFLGDIPTKRISLKVTAMSDNRVLVYAPQCISMILKAGEKPNNMSKAEKKTKQKVLNNPPAEQQTKPKFQFFRGKKINLFEKEELEGKNDWELIRQRNYLMSQLDFNVIATDTNIWIADEERNGKKQMKYKQMLLFLGQTQREKAIRPDDEYTFNDYRFEMHNAVYSEINSFSKKMEDDRQPMAWSAKCLISEMTKREERQLKARLELVVDEAEDDVNKEFADKWIRTYSKNIMVEERLSLLIITNDRDLQIRVNNDCNRDWTDYNKKPEHKDTRIGHDLLPVTERGDVIMNITDQIQMIDSILQERTNRKDNRKYPEKRTN